jgi:hypothetical protein
MVMVGAQVALDLVGSVVRGGVGVMKNRRRGPSYSLPLIRRIRTALPCRGPSVRAQADIGPGGRPARW